MNKEVDTFLEDRYRHAPEVMTALRFTYTNWSMPHSITANQSAKFMKKSYDRGEVTKHTVN